MATFLNINALPLADQFINLPYKDEKVVFTGEISEEINDGFGNNYKLAFTNIIRPNNDIICGEVRFYHDDKLKTFIKKLDCNFYKS